MKDLDLNPLTPEEEHIILHKWTERPFTGQLLDEKRAWTFLCRQCDLPLYYSDMKFDSWCGRPSFDDAISSNVHEDMDADGRRVEITCKRCWGHLWHIFRWEELTEKDTRHCVNSISMKFVDHKVDNPYDLLETATLWAWCYRCVEAVFRRLRGIHTVTSWYMWGRRPRPSYAQVSTWATGHVEVIQLMFDPNIIDYSTILRVFFTSHDPTQLNRQGNDVGTQYASVIFTHSDTQHEIAKEMISSLQQANIYAPDVIVTDIREASDFWPAEEYHHQYYDRNPEQRYCQFVIDPKIRKLKEQWSDLLIDEDEL